MKNDTLTLKFRSGDTCGFSDAIYDGGFGPVFSDANATLAHRVKASVSKFEAAFLTPFSKHNPV